MTKKELSQVYFLKREIRQLEQRIKELETAAMVCTSKITGGPNGTGINDKIGNYAEQIADLKNLLALNLRKCVYEFNRLDKFIQSVDDSEMRTILTLRYLQGFSWQKVAKSMGNLGDGSTE